MTLEDAILLLAEAIQQLAAASGAYSSTPDLALPAEPVGPTYGPPTFTEWMDEHRVSIADLNGRKPTQCSICKKVGVNARTHPHHQ